MARLSYLCSLLLIFLLHFSPGLVTPTTFTIINNCDQTIWPGLLSNAGVSQLPSTGFPLHKSESKTITPPTSWAGRLWGRTLCTTDPTTSQFTCQTGDCGSGKVDCLGNGAATPATLAEFTLDGSGGQDFYDVSLVDGYNLPMLVVPRGGSGDNCTATGCAADLNGPCPADMKVMGVGGKSVGCRSACDKFNTPEYCCSGAYGSPDTCKPSMYSTTFKTACPRAYSYAYDDRTSTFICGGSPDYTITFCPSPSTSQKAAASSSPDGQGGATSDDDGSSSSSSTSSSSPFENSSMVYVGALDSASSGSRLSSPYTWTHNRQLPISIGFLLAAATAHWWWWLLWWALLGHH